MIRIYTDGAWRRKDKAAGAGVVIIWETGKLYVHHQYIGDATNNRAELQAIKLGLKKILPQVGKSRSITIYSDSTYAIGMLTKKWKIKANKELLAEIFEIMNYFENLKFRWVKAHSRNKYNRLADLAANIAIDQHFKLDTIDWLAEEPEEEGGVYYGI